ncbi:hypothetical protein CBS101457_000491 [Exobasidium rhododendri]|nr:hypothetical protein CBS101457_000491 [Exobasidium rhododendri]
MDLLQSVDPTKSSAFADPFRPSFYELAAQEQLQDLLKPCLRYILSVLAQRNPRHLLRIVNRFDEVYALLMWAIERHYLRTWGSSFAENFYGLRRRRRPGIATPRAKTASSARTTQQTLEALRPIDIYVSLFTLVGLPYVQTKLHDLWDREGGGLDAEQGDLFADDEDQAEGTAPRRSYVEDQTARAARTAKLKLLLRTCFRRGYPYVGTAWQLWLLSYNVRYLFDKTPFYRPWLRMMRMDIRRVGMNDYALKYALPASIFFFKFLEWWYSSDNARRRRPGGGDSGGEKGDGAYNLDPPQVLAPHLQGVVYEKLKQFKEVPIPKTRLGLGETLGDSEEGEVESRGRMGLSHNGCPICGTSPINNPTVFPTGYVCCYTCSFAYVGEWHRCPVTLKATEVSDLRRVLG